jgi:hypothetical protein
VTFPYMLGRVPWLQYHLHYHCTSFPSPLFNMVSTGFIILFSCKYMNYIDHIHHPSILHSSLPNNTHPITGPVLHSYSSVLKVYIHYLKEFCHGISPMNILHSSLLFHSYPLLFNSFQCISFCHFSTQMQ